MATPFLLQRSFTHALSEDSKLPVGHIVVYAGPGGFAMHRVTSKKKSFLLHHECSRSPRHIPDGPQ